LYRTPSFAPGLGAAAIAMAAVALAILVVAAVPALADRGAVRRFAVAAAGLGVAATLLAPAAYALDTMNTGYGGGDPHPGPGTTSSGFGGGFQNGGAPGVFQDGGTGGTRPDDGFRDGNPGAGNGGPGGQGAATDSALIDYLVANRGNARWIVAVNGSGSAGQIELATGLPVMAMGGFTGSDPWPTLERLQQYIASGELRFVVVGGGMGGGVGGFGGSSSSVESWVASTCTAVTGVNSSLYDCAGAA
jgi:hypothetical protein